MVPSVELPRFVEAAAGEHATAKVRWPFAFVHYFPSEGIVEQLAELTCCTQREHLREKMKSDLSEKVLCQQNIWTNLE